MNSNLQPVKTVPADLISLAEAAKYLGVGSATLRLWIARGELVGYRVGERLIRVRRSDIDAKLRPIGGTQ